MARRQQLVCQQLENASSDVLEKYPDIISHYMRRRNGVYALYRRERLYYVGLATNLRSRLKQHLRDRHRGLWDGRTAGSSGTMSDPPVNGCN